MKNAIHGLVLPWLVVIALMSAAQGEAERHWDGSHTTPVHRLPLRDGENEEILPSVRRAMPFSAKNTCGPCHNYATVGKGLHFSSSRGEEAPGRAGEPWIWVDERLGVQLPLSYRGWLGTWNPEDLGMTPWRFTQVFGRHFPGGDVAEPADILADPGSRWDVSGTVEINCLGCHNASPRQDLSEWAKQMARENYRWAATAASGLGEVGGMASRLPAFWTIHDGADPDDKEYAVPPSVRYGQSQFGERGRALFDIAYRPPDRNCLQCHSASPVDGARWEQEQDVHSAAGIRCADCHRNGLDHKMIRGYEAEASERDDSTVAEFSCRGCHLGIPELEQESLAAAMGGRLGAPRPAHVGIPVIHFEKMSCTSCHSGPWPEAQPSLVRTSKANRLGIHGVAQWRTGAPRVGEPVFMRGADGKLAPHRMMWPAFWGRLEDGEITPLLPDSVREAGRGILDAEEQIGSILGSMGTGLAAFVELNPDLAPAGQAVFLTPGTVYRQNADGGLDAAGYDGDLAIGAGGLWAKEREGQIVPLVPDFDPAAEQLELVVEDAILKTLEWLAPYEDPRGEPVAMLGNKVYRQDAGGYLEIGEQSGGAVEAFRWGWRRDGEISPLVPDFVVRAVADTETVDETLNEEQAGLVLEALAERAQGNESAEFVYVSSGKMFRLDGTGQLVAGEHEAAAPYAWPLGHNVRPASQSLGARACTDCHAKEAPFYFATIKAQGPLKTASALVTRALDFQGEGEPMYIGTSRFFKWLIIVTMVLLLLHIALDVTRRVLNRRATG